MNREFVLRKKEYIPAQVWVIVIAPQLIICGSGSSSGDTPGPTELTPGGLI